VTKKRKLSPRGQRRAAERAAVELARQRVRLAELEPGGTAERPIVVESASVIETRARDTPCAVCEGALEVVEHASVAHGESRLRRVDLRCRACHAPRSIWFRIEPPRLN
jgi:hypothetical protein